MFLVIVFSFRQSQMSFAPPRKDINMVPFDQRDSSILIPRSHKCFMINHGFIMTSHYIVLASHRCQNNVINVTTSYFSVTSDYCDTLSLYCDTITENHITISQFGVISSHFCHFCDVIRQFGLVLVSNEKTVFCQDRPD